MTISTLTIDNTNAHNGAMKDPDSKNPEVLERSAGRRQFSAKYKAQILAEYDTLSRIERGALLRREGLYSSLITTWREQRERGAEQALSQKT
jgi:transposase